MWGLPPSFCPRRDTQLLTSGLFEELENAIGKLSSRNLSSYHRILATRPELPIVISPLPFIAIEQVLFMSSVYSYDEMFVTSAHRCAACQSSAQPCRSPPCSVFFMPKFKQLLQCVSEKYGDYACDFIHVAGQVLSKIVVGCSSLVAVYCGRTLGDGTNTKKMMRRMKLQNIPTFLVQQWGERLDYRQTRIFEWRPVPGSLAAPCYPTHEKGGGVPPPELHHNHLMIPTPCLYVVAKGKPSEVIRTNDFCMDILTRFIDSRIPAPLLVRAYFAYGPVGSHPMEYITIRIRQRAFPIGTPDSHMNYDLILIKGQPFTNLDIDAIMTTAAPDAADDDPISPGRRPLFVKRVGKLGTAREGIRCLLPKHSVNRDDDE
jgi:hypothetical protein